VARQYDFTIGLGHPGVRKVAWLMGPRLLGLAAGQVNFVASTILASNLGVGAVTAYNYAFQLSQIPVGVLGVSVAVALFPTFSRDAALGRIADIRRQLSTSLRILIFLAAPLTAMLIVLARPLAAVFFQYGLFTGEATDRTAGALVFFSLGLAGHIVVHVLTRAFYAMQDTRVPVLWAVIAVAINVPLMTILSGPMGVEGLALALSISATLEVIGLALALRRRIDSIDEHLILPSALRSAVAAVVAGAVMLGGLAAAQEWFAEALANGLGRLVVLLLLVAAGGAAYLLTAIAVGSQELGQVRHYLFHRGSAEAA
jgi:putative peptidoglycan lipid II flippase